MKYAFHAKMGMASSNHAKIEMIYGVHDKKENAMKIKKYI